MKDIEIRRRELLAELAMLDELQAQTAPVKHEDVSGPSKSLTAVRWKFTRPLRDLVLDALEEIGFMSYGQQLAMYIKARFGRDVTATRFGTLSVDEEKAFKRDSSRTVWLCHGVTHDRAEAVKRLWARSDWELAHRVVGPVFGRAQYLRSTARFATLAMKADEIAANPDLLRFIAADHARDLGVTVRHGRFELEQWHDLAEKELAAIVDKELGDATRAALSFSKKLTPTEQLFGAATRPVSVVPRKRA
jgi:hypothetical protein